MFGNMTIYLYFLSYCYTDQSKVVDFLFAPYLFLLYGPYYSWPVSNKLLLPQICWVIPVAAADLRMICCMLLPVKAWLYLCHLNICPEKNTRFLNCSMLSLYSKNLIPIVIIPPATKLGGGVYFRLMLPKWYCSKSLVNTCNIGGRYKPSCHLNVLVMDGVKHVKLIKPVGGGKSINTYTIWP